MKGFERRLRRKRSLVPFRASIAVRSPGKLANRARLSPSAAPTVVGSEKLRSVARADRPLASHTADIGASILAASRLLPALAPATSMSFALNRTNRPASHRSLIVRAAAIDAPIDDAGKARVRASPYAQPFVRVGRMVWVAWTSIDATSCCISRFAVSAAAASSSAVSGTDATSPLATGAALDPPIPTGAMGGGAVGGNGGGGTKPDAAFAYEICVLASTSTPIASTSDEIRTPFTSTSSLFAAVSSTSSPRIAVASSSEEPYMSEGYVQMALRARATAMMEASPAEDTHVCTGCVEGRACWWWRRRGEAGRSRLMMSREDRREGWSF